MNRRGAMAIWYQTASCCCFTSFPPKLAASQYTVLSRMLTYSLYLFLWWIIADGDTCLSNPFLFTLQENGRTSDMRKKLSYLFILLHFCQTYISVR